MKRFLLFFLLVIVASTACKKSTKEQETPGTTTLTGIWKEKVPPYSRMIPSTIIFRADSTYTWSSVNLEIKQGTYHTGLSGNPSILNVIFTGTEAPFVGKTTLEMVSFHEIRITSPATLVRNYARSR